MDGAEAAQWFAGTVALLVAIGAIYWRALRSRVEIHTEPGSWFSLGNSCALVISNNGSTTAHISEIAAIWPAGSTLAFEKRAPNIPQPWLPGELLPLEAKTHLSLDVTVLPGKRETVEFYFFPARNSRSSCRISVTIDESRMTQLSKTRLVMVTKNAVSQAR